MIERELLEIIESPVDTTSAGDRLLRIVDQFRRGRDVNDLVLLLRSSNAELVSTVAWIFGELPFDLYNSEHVISQLRELLDHEDPQVRFSALGAIYPALNSLGATAQVLLRKLRSDSSEGVRRRAEAATAQLEKRA